MALRDNMIMWLPLDEASGTRVDAHTNGNDMTDNNTVGQGTIFGGDGADFERSNSEYLSLTDAAQTGLDLVDSDFSFAFKVRFESVGTDTHTFFAKWDANGSRQYMARISGTTIQMYASNDGNSSGSGYATWSPSTATDYFVIYTYNTTSGDVNIYVDNSALTMTQGAESSSASNTGAAFNLGIYWPGSVSHYLDGIMADFSAYSVELDSTERSELWNSGSPLSYADTAPAGSDIKNIAGLAHADIKSMAGLEID